MIGRGRFLEGPVRHEPRIAEDVGCAAVRVAAPMAVALGLGLAGPPLRALRGG